ncbi:MAG: hypothetical protein MRY74_06835 [Neomegalonema sp.]|nr:hypothetical protein [Neomegalonema sp.]
MIQLGGVGATRRAVWTARVLVAAFCVIAADIGAAMAQDVCKLYSNVRLRGVAQGLQDGETKGRFNFFLDKRVSSVRVAPGCRAVLFSRRGLTGDRLPVRETLTHLPGDWKNRARSAACECGRRGDRDRRGRDSLGRPNDRRADQRKFGDGAPPRLSRRGAACIAFRDRGFRGAWRSFARDEGKKRVGRRLRSDISSIQVARGCRAVVEFGAPYRMVLRESVRRLPRAVDDRAVSLRCRCGR